MRCYRFRLLCFNDAFATIDLCQLVQKAIDLIPWDADTRHVPLEVSAPAYIPAVECEPLLILQVISNLVRNAVDATGKSGTPVAVMEAFISDGSMR